MKLNHLYKALAAVTLAGMALSAQADTFPAKPITLIVPFPAGGTADLAARTIAQAMGPILDQSIIVDNRAGAGGNIGIGALKRSAPDGYTIGLGTIGTQTINEFLYPDMPFDPSKDFESLAMVFTTPNVIAVRADSEMKSLQDLLAKAKANKDAPVTYASPGVGSSVHISGAYLEGVSGIEMLHIPFKGVSGSMPALIGGQVDVLMDNIPSTISHLKDGSRVRALAVTSAERSPSLPNVPTVAESGLKDFDVNAWFALYAPAGTPADVQAKLIDAANQALAKPEVQERLATFGADAGKLSGKELHAFEVSERERWGKLIKDRNITTN
jgi:tripartite-type tricarboxylate transporter receptor subunit TctC